jgi:phosphatidylglycerophosphatase A
LLKSAPRSDTLHWKELFRKSNNSGKIALLLSSWFGLGLLPGAPGTAASAIALPISLGLKQLGWRVESVFLVLLVCVAYWSCNRAWGMALEDDPPWIVIDEVIGLLVSLLGSQAATDLLLGFVLFRVFDIMKPYPIGRMERLPGAKGILMDDLVAGIFANLCLRVFHLL